MDLVGTPIGTELLRQRALGSVVDAYTELPWVTLCEAVACVRYAAPTAAPVGLAAPRWPSGGGKALAALRLAPC